MNIEDLRGLKSLIEGIEKKPVIKINEEKEDSEDDYVVNKNYKDDEDEEEATPNRKKLNLRKRLKDLTLSISKSKISGRRDTLDEEEEEDLEESYSDTEIKADSNFRIKNGLPVLPTMENVNNTKRVPISENKPRKVFEPITVDEVMFKTVADIRSSGTPIKCFGSVLKPPSLETTEENLDEASVIGGDFGRWKPATDAAEESGSDLAKAISKKEELSYKFGSAGNPQSDDSGTILWFGIETSDENDITYFLGIQIRKDSEKDDPEWNIVLKKGMGIGSATEVSSKSKLKSDEIADAIKDLF